MLFGVVSLSVATAGSVFASELKKSPVPEALHGVPLMLSQQEMQWVGARIYQNECAGNPDYLIHWGKGEEFPSLGIGHFIWYPAGVEERFTERFPQMVDYVSQYHPPPDWLNRLSPMEAPWSSPQQMQRARASKPFLELQNWLLATQSYQAEFIVQQLHARLSSYWSGSQRTKHQREVLQPIINRLFTFKEGRFALVDYVNFKGIGDPAEQYQGEQWGLISVLQQLRHDHQDWSRLSDAELLEAFIAAAKQRLALRIRLAPEQRNEQRWLKGWFVRLDGYRP